jgi:hypothetical protein
VTSLIISDRKKAEHYFKLLSGLREEYPASEKVKVAFRVAQVNMGKPHSV